MPRALHRRLAWIAGAVAILWAATGLLHPIMSWTAPRPAIQAPPAMALSLDGLAAPGPLLQAAGVDHATRVRLVEVQGERFWFTQHADGGLGAIHARTGAAAPDAPRTHAVALARHYAGLADAPVLLTEPVNEFSLDYPGVNRLLPVWKIAFDTPGRLTLYVDPANDRLAAVADDRRRVLLAVFQNMHTLNFLSGIEPLRVAALALLIASLVATALFGAAMAFSAKGRKLRGAHRVAALSALPFVLSFALSGLFHLFVAAGAPAAGAPAPSFPTAALAALPRLSGGPVGELVALGDGAGAAMWRASLSAASQDGLYFSADAGALSPIADSDRARALAGAGPNADVSLQTGFDAAYGFANKRLPVWRVTEGGAAAFVEVRENLRVAAAPGPLAAAEAWSFDVIHKWRFLEPIGRRNRDYAMMLAAGLVIITAGLGLALARPRRRQGESS